MKRKITLLLLMAGIVIKTNAQLVFYEGFNAPFNPAASGWNIQNLSSPIGTNSWFQGNNAFPALSGNPADYFACNFNNTAATGTNNTISTWLITPTLNLENGAMIEFATRAPNAPIADRLQVYYSIGTGTNVGTTAGTATNTAGTFTTLLIDLNSGQLAAPGYPKRWNVIPVLISGLSGPVVGRVAFRYYLTNAGAAGANGNFVGIDEFRYSLPCNFPQGTFAQMSINSCAGQTVACFGGLGTTSPITSYTWNVAANVGVPSNTIGFTASPGNNSSVITSTAVVAPTITSTYYYLAQTTPGCVRLEVSLPIVVTPDPTVTLVQTPTTVCSGSTFTLSSTGATTYSYIFANTTVSNNPATITSPTVSVLTSAQFTVIGRNAAGCTEQKTVSLVINPNPTVTAVFSKSVACVKNSVTVSATGATTYTWSGSASTASAITFTTATTAGVNQYTVTGSSPAGCQSEAIVATMTVSACTGIDDLSGGITELSAYPNPFEKQLNFKEFSGTVDVYNEIGQVVLQVRSVSIKTINTSDLSPGIYIVRIYTDLGDQKSFRVVKN